MFYVILLSVTLTSASSARESIRIPVDSVFETQFTNPSTTWMEHMRPQDGVAQWKRKWEDFNLHNWLFPPTQAKQYARFMSLTCTQRLFVFDRPDFFRLRASELPTFLSLRTVPAAVWQKSPNSILRNGELISPESAVVKSGHLVVEVLEDK